jgi:hypothetical protein
MAIIRITRERNRAAMWGKPGPKYSDSPHYRFRVETMDGARWHDESSPTISLVSTFEAAVELASKEAFSQSYASDAAQFALDHPELAKKFIQEGY